MELTFIGIAQIVIGTYVVLLGSVRSALVFLFVSVLFAGSAAIVLPDLGGSSIPPDQFALLFTTLRIAAPGGGYLGLLPDAIRDNKWLVLFSLYGIAAAYLGPRMFAGAIDIYPMRPDLGTGLFDTVPLAPSPQNLTAGFYMVGTLLMAISSYVFCRFRVSGQALLFAVLLGSWLHVATGLIDLATRGTGLESVLGVFRNAGYIPLDHSVSGFIRIRGVLAETSTYAAIGFAFFLANAELWYRSIRPRATGLVAAILALLLVFSTASTAYVALAAYGLFFVLRAMAFPAMAPSGKLLRAAVFGFATLVVIAILLALVPRLPYAVYELVVDMTFGKPESLSGQQRLFWAMQGIDAFAASYGVGIGPGSFRSSSMLTAILGSMGVVGALTFVLHLKAVFEGSRRSTWGAGPQYRQSVGGALAVAALVSLVPAAISSPHAFPGSIFAMFAGAALALRAQAARPQPEKPPSSRPPWLDRHFENKVPAR